MGRMAREIETNLSYFQLGGEGRTETLVSLSIFLPASSVLRLSRGRSSSRMGAVLSPSEGVSIALSSHLRARLLPFSLPIHLHAFFFLPRIQSRFNRVSDLKPSPFPLFARSQSHSSVGFPLSSHRSSSNQLCSRIKLKLDLLSSLSLEIELLQRHPQRFQPFRQSQGEEGRDQEGGEEEELEACGYHRQARSQWFLGHWK